MAAKEFQVYTPFILPVTKNSLEAAKSYFILVFELTFNIKWPYCILARFLDSVNRMEKPLILGADVKASQIDKKTQIQSFQHPK